MQHNDANTDPIFAVKLTGILSPKDIERYERRFQEQLPGRVIVTDNRVEDIREVTGMRPRNAIVTVHHKRREFESIGCDGNTPVFRDYEEVEQVPAKVWPVAAGERELLVEWEDGSLGVACIQEGMRFVGIDMDEHYCEIAEKRIGAEPDTVFD